MVETRATRIVTRVKNVYNEVEELLADARGGGCGYGGGDDLSPPRRARATSKAEQDIKLKGEKIHLG